MLRLRNGTAAIGMVAFVAQRGLPVPVGVALFVEVWAYALIPLFAKSTRAAVLGLAVAFFANLQFGFGMPTCRPLLWPLG